MKLESWMSGRMSEQTKPATWEDVVALAHALESDALAGNVAPSEGARLVRLVIEFHSSLARNVRRRTPTPTPPPVSE